MFKQLQKLGKSFMLPIAILPLCGFLCLELGSLIECEYDCRLSDSEHAVLQAVFQIMSATGNVVFANLALIMCIGLAVGLAKKIKVLPPWRRLVSFLVMNASIGAMITVFNPSVESIDTGVVGAIVIGILVTYLNNRYRGFNYLPFLDFWRLAVYSDRLIV